MGNSNIDGFLTYPISLYSQINDTPISQPPTLDQEIGLLGTAIDTLALTIANQPAQGSDVAPSLYNGSIGGFGGSPNVAPSAAELEQAIAQELVALLQAVGSAAANADPEAVGEPSAFQLPQPQPNSVYGNGDSAVGEANNIVGSHDAASGYGNTAIGNVDTVVGSNNFADGGHNTAVGSNITIFGSHVHANGNDIQVYLPGGSAGNNGTISATSGETIFGNSKGGLTTIQANGSFSETNSNGTVIAQGDAAAAEVAGIPSQLGAAQAAVIGGFSGQPSPLG